MSIESLAKFLMSVAVIAGLAIAYPQTGNAQINDKVARNNGAPFFANQRTSRNIQHARDYSRGLQQYTTHARVIQPTVTQAESQMLGQQLQAIQRDMVIVREEYASNPKVVEQVKKIETQLGQATTVQKSLHTECCKASPDGKACAEICGKIHASLDEIKKEHDKLLKELGHEEAAHDHHADHEHHNPVQEATKK
ncbi:MAG: hypothetical protein J0M26_14510 [Planctomycetes bacterium]|nr:hypothetical protein [Planctomycetota bacterium]